MHHLGHPFGGIELLVGVVGVGADYLEERRPVERLLEVIGAEEHRQLLDLAVAAVGGHRDLCHVLLCRKDVRVGLLSIGCRLIGVGLRLLERYRRLVVGLGGHLGVDPGLLELGVVGSELDLDGPHPFGGGLLRLLGLGDVIFAGVVRVRLRG